MTPNNLLWRIVFAIVVVLALTPLHDARAQAKAVKMAVTTSVENSGLLEVIVSPFEAETGYQVHVIAVGTGRALMYGRAGDVDCVLVHSPEAEEEFVRSGFGVGRTELMYNSFVVVGSPDDPAMVRDSHSATEAMRRIAELGAKSRESRARPYVLFVSRGDDSGTHQRELSLWSESATFPKRGWYLDVGQGMAQALTIASELGAYTLTDRGTYLSLRSRLDLVVLYDSDPVLLNQYSLILVNPQVHPAVNYKGAQALMAWFASPQCAALIDAYSVDGEQLFFAGTIAGSR